MKKNFIEFSWIFHSSEVHEKTFHRVVPMNRLHFIDLKSNLMGNSYKEDLVVIVSLMDYRRLGLLGACAYYSKW